MDIVKKTLEKFGGSNNIIKSYPHWSLLIKPEQVTLGSMVLIANEQAGKFSELTDGAFLDLKTITLEIESRLSDYLEFEKINYLMLMMIDPAVHFHIFPRYSQKKTINNTLFIDSGWPGPPELLKPTQVSADTVEQIRQALHIQLK